LRGEIHWLPKKRFGENEEIDRKALWSGGRKGGGTETEEEFTRTSQGGCQGKQRPRELRGRRFRKGWLTPQIFRKMLRKGGTPKKKRQI